MLFMFFTEACNASVEGIISTHWIKKKRFQCVFSAFVDRFGVMLAYRYIHIGYRENSSKAWWAFCELMFKLASLKQSVDVQTTSPYLHDN